MSSAAQVHVAKSKSLLLVLYQTQTALLNSHPTCRSENKVIFPWFMFMYVGPGEEHCVFSRYRATFPSLISHLPSGCKNAQRTFFSSPKQPLINNLFFAYTKHKVISTRCWVSFVLLCFTFIYLFIFPPFFSQSNLCLFFCFVLFFNSGFTAALSSLCVVISCGHCPVQPLLWMMKMMMLMITSSLSLGKSGFFLLD